MSRSLGNYDKRKSAKFGAKELIRCVFVALVSERFSSNWVIDNGYFNSHAVNHCRIDSVYSNGEYRIG
ncbi:MAG: hypothetical protein NWQ97_01230 [Ilumatobacteraceae bacterium]|nr:hypothetical protein [Ilumatobacteraceae bacterium]